MNSKRLIGTVKIKFLNKKQASVEYLTDVSDIDQKEIDLIQIGALYYAKILFNLNKSTEADNLIVYIQKVVSRLMSQDTMQRLDILSPDQELLESSHEDGLEYSGELFEEINTTRIILTRMDENDTTYYSPISVIMLIQYLVKVLSDDSLIFFLLVLGGMNKYYRNHNSYADTESLIGAPSFGVKAAEGILNGG